MGRISAIALLVATLVIPSLTADDDVRFQPVPAYLMSGSYKFRAQYKHEGEEYFVTGSAYGVSLSWMNLSNGSSLIMTAAHNFFDDSDELYGDPCIEIRKEQGNMKVRAWVPVTLLAVDRGTDIAIARVGTSLPGTTELAADDTVKPGDPIAAAGFPVGGGLTVTFGYFVSRDPEREPIYPWLFQGSIPIYHGNSGGAVFDLQTKKIIGIVVAGVGSGKSGMASNVCFFVSQPAIKKFLSSRLVIKALGGIMPPKEAPKDEPAPIEGPPVPPDLRDHNSQ